MPRGKELSDLSRRFLELRPGQSLVVQTKTEKGRLFRLAHRRRQPFSAWELVNGGYRVWREI